MLGFWVRFGQPIALGVGVTRLRADAKGGEHGRGQP